MKKKILIAIAVIITVLIANYYENKSRSEELADAVYYLSEKVTDFDKQTKIKNKELAERVQNLNLLAPDERMQLEATLQHVIDSTKNVGESWIAEMDSISIVLSRPFIRQKVWNTIRGFGLSSKVRTYNEETTQENLKDVKRFFKPRRDELKELMSI